MSASGFGTAPKRSSYDVAIVGGAVMGSSIACHLAMDPDFTGSLLVIEKDPSYTKCASALSAASIRQQFSCPVNIEISLYGIDFLREIGARLAVQHHVALATADLQQRLVCRGVHHDVGVEGVEHAAARQPP